MTDLLLAGSVAAAFAAGLVAFFAPCCSGVMLPTYLAAVSGGSRMRVARMSAIYVAGVSLVVLPITLGAAALASRISGWHPQLFVLGGVMMIGVAIALYRGSMLPLSVPQPQLTGSKLSVFGLGAFSGAATACCAPVLAGAIALSATSASIPGGLLLGGAYILGLIAPLLPVAFAAGRLHGRIPDRRLTLRVGSYAKRITASRLAGSAIFAVFGVLFIALALTGNAEAAPGFQRTLGEAMRSVGSRIDDIPNVVFAPGVIVLTGFLLYTVLRDKGEKTS
ncbi:Cytochrome C biogenesis protein transmembrane region [Gaiella occulta]|uniref:Cytochrome C biogenesis protein transmembrane region n=1 Tax=Gaiella occulta TaxID=1002870 RepID=A0A7M2YVQ1_9ACTN|nr:cytochrome c biogenesis protein CcdA [Gaiella occulta]RDI73659.1 Cytochrome C biogenesis protein transmembrane region [Gaiella occulta]